MAKLPLAQAAEPLAVELRLRGYVPDESGPDFVRAGRSFTVLDSPLGTVLVVVGDEVTVSAFDHETVQRWSAVFSADAPLNAITAVMDAAEAHVKNGFDQ